MSKIPLLQVSKSGLYCEAGGFYVDPWAPVDKAIITHAHSDHARMGTASYLAVEDGRDLLRTRLGEGAQIQTLPYGETLNIGGCQVSFHPAGHILGSAQVRVEYKGEVWVVSGDYKLEPDSTCAAFEPVRCNTFITEATFGLPIFRWSPSREVFDQINRWWRTNQERGKASVLYCYALGKAQRILAGVDAGIGPIYTHGAVERLTEDYRRSGVVMPATMLAGIAPRKTDWSRGLILAPPSAAGSLWLRRFGAIASGFASGWMQVRGMRRRRAIDRGFVLSDHSDWTDLLSAISQSNAEKILVTHGYVPMLVRYLQELGMDAEGLSTRFEGEQEETDAFAIDVAETEVQTEADKHTGADSKIDEMMVAKYSEDGQS